MQKEMVNTAKVLKVNKNDYLLDDATSLIKTENIPVLKVGDKVEISTDGKTVFWNFIRH